MVASNDITLDFGYEPLKSQSKIGISSFVNPSKIFVWGASNDPSNSFFPTTTTSARPTTGAN